MVTRTTLTDRQPGRKWVDLGFEFELFQNKRHRETIRSIVLFKLFKVCHRERTTLRPSARTFLRRIRGWTRPSRLAAPATIIIIHLASPHHTHTPPRHEPQATCLLHHPRSRHLPRHHQSSLPVPPRSRCIPLPLRLRSILIPSQPFPPGAAAAPPFKQRSQRGR
jgi:hypothetical protein